MTKYVLSGNPPPIPKGLVPLSAVEKARLSQLELLKQAGQNKEHRENAKAALNLGGLVHPGADVASSLMSLQEGDYVEAGFSLIAVVPIAGDILGYIGKSIWKRVRRVPTPPAALQHTPTPAAPSVSKDKLGGSDVSPSNQGTPRAEGVEGGPPPAQAGGGGNKGNDKGPPTAQDTPDGPGGPKDGDGASEPANPGTTPGAATGAPGAPHGTPRDFDLDAPEGFSYGPSNPTMKTIKRGDSLVDYRVEKETLHIDWTDGKDLAARIKDIQGTPDGVFRKIEGYATEKLEGKSNEVLLRFGRQTANTLQGKWEVTIRLEESKRYLVFTRVD